MSTNDVMVKLVELRKRVGVIKGKKKDGVKFKVRSAEELNDKLRGPCDELGLLIFPVAANGNGFPVEDGTLASINLTLRVQAVSDGSYIDLMGFGLGADNQDKAGGKASTYAWKSILLQTLLAGGAEDTDDTDTPIKGGVRAKTAGKATTESARQALEAVTDQGSYDTAIAMVRTLAPEKQLDLVDLIKATKARLAPAAAQA